MTQKKKTAEVCRQERIEGYCIRNWLKAGKLAEPGRDASGHFWWTPADVEKLRKVARTYRPRRRAGRGG
jgi:hypothetical protein